MKMAARLLMTEVAKGKDVKGISYCDKYESLRDEKGRGRKK